MVRDGLWLVSAKQFEEQFEEEKNIFFGVNWLQSIYMPKKIKKSCQCRRPSDLKLSIIDLHLHLVQAKSVVYI